MAEDLKVNSDYQILDFWNKENYDALNLPKAKVITAIGMFYDMEDPNQFIKDAALVLDNDGIFIAQLMTLKPMLEKRDLGISVTNTWNIILINPLFIYSKLMDWKYTNLKKNGINGGSYKIFARKLDKGSLQITENLGPDDVIKFMKEVDQIRDETKSLFSQFKSEGKKVYGYGASTKGNVICQYFDLTNEDMIGIADKNEAKEGLFNLTDIPIVSEESAREEADVFSYFHTALLMNLSNVKKIG